MKVYRGLGSLLFKEIDPYYTNDGDHLVYGAGTSYSLELKQAEFYCESSSSNDYGWILSYNYNPKNVLEIYENNFEDLDNMCLDQFNMIINNEIVISKNLVNYAQKKSYDCVKFLYDEFDQHVLVLNKKYLELDEILLFVEGQFLVDKIKKLNIPFDGEYFKVSLDRIVELDEILKNYN